MRKALFIGCMVLGLAAQAQETSTATCTATATGPTFGLNTGMMWFHFDTTCDAPVELIQIDAVLEGPEVYRTGSTTCTNTDKCSYLLGVSYKRGTWTWTNHTTYPGGTDTATNTVTFNN